MPALPRGPRASYGIGLGRSADGELVPLPVEPGQGRHLVLLGETGMGKSSLLVSVAVRAASEAGLILLDPLGETAAEVRRELQRRGRNLLWIAPGADAAGANALAAAGDAMANHPVRGERELDALVQALRRVRRGSYQETAYWGPRLEEMLGRSLRAAALLPRGTLEDAYELLGPRERALGAVPPPAREAVRALSERVRDRPEDTDGARRLLYEVVRNPSLSKLLCSRDAGFRWTDLVAPGRIVIISGAAGEIGEHAARYLLSTYLALIWSRLLARPDPSKTFVFLDEAQWFANDGLAEMLRLARRCNAHIALASQSLSSLPPSVAEAVRTNVSEWVVFRSSALEARELARSIAGLSPEAIVSLPRGQAAVLTAKGLELRWVRTARLPPPQGIDHEGQCRNDADPPAVTSSAELLDARAGRDRRVAADAQANEGPAFDRLLHAVATGTPAADGSVRVPWAQLVGVTGAAEQELRALGGELGRRGAIARRDSGPDGPAWWVRPTHLSRASAQQLPREPAEDAGGAQPL